MNVNNRNQYGGTDHKRLPSALDTSIPPDFNFILPGGQIVRGRVWMVSDPQIVTNGHTFSANWAMDDQTNKRGHKLRWVLIEDVE